MANDETLDPQIRLDAAKAALSYCHAKLRPVVADVDELVELDGRIAAARAKTSMKEVSSFEGLAERLSRARARISLTASERAELARLRLIHSNAVVAADVPRAPDEPVIDEQPRAILCRSAPPLMPHAERR